MKGQNLFNIHFIYPFVFISFPERMQMPTTHIVKIHTLNSLPLLNKRKGSRTRNFIEIHLHIAIVFNPHTAFKNENFRIDEPGQRK